MERGPWVDVPRQDGRRFVVTGANSGVGLQTAAVLASRGAEVIMACRSLERGEAARASIEHRIRDGGRLEMRTLDVSDLASVRSFAGRLLVEVGEVDVVVGNAGALALPFGLTADGVERHLATNHLGHFALANLLLPRVRDRVVVVSSVSARHGELDLDDLDWSRRGYRPYAAYAASKLANLLFLGELQRRLTASGSTVRATGAHPGTSSTGITGHSGSGLVTRIGAFGHRMVGMPAWRGALPSLFAATMDVPGNTYVGPDGPQQMFGWPTAVGRPRAALDPALGRALWQRSEELSDVGYPF